MFTTFKQKVRTVQCITKKGWVRNVRKLPVAFFGSVESFSHKLHRRDMEQKYRMYGKVLLNVLQDTFRDVSTHLSVSPTLLKDDGPMGGWMASNTSA